jgi:hypothetical protein
MKKFFKYLSITFGALLLIATVTFCLLAKFHHQAAHERLVQILNEKFHEKITFKDFSFSYLREFPRVHIELKEVNVKDGNKEILNVGNIDILLNLIGLWNSNVNVEKLIISDANIFNEVDSLGNKPHLFGGNKKAETDTNRQIAEIDAKNIIIKNSRIHLTNQIKGNRIIFHINSAHLQLSKIDSVLTLKSEIDGNLDSLIANENTLFYNQPVQFAGVIITINQASKEIKLEKGEIFAHTLKLIPQFNMHPKDDGNIIDLKITTEGDFNTVLELVELRNKLKFTQVNPNAKVAVTYLMEGFVNPFEKPYSEIDFEISNAEITGETLPFPLKIGFVSGNYNNGESHSTLTTSVKIDTIRAEIEDSYLNGKFTIENFSDPFVDLHLTSKIDLSHIIKDTLKLKITGNINADIAFKGKVNDLKKAKYAGYLGGINFKNVQVNLKEKGYTIYLSKGSATLNNHLLVIPAINGSFNNTNFVFTGNIHNPLLHLINKEESLLANLKFNFGTLDITKLNIQNEQNTKTRNKKKKPFMGLLNHVAANFTINGKKLITQNGEVENLVVSIKQNYKKVNIKSVAFNYQKGKISGTGDLTINNQGISDIHVDLKGNFKEFDFVLPHKSKDSSKQKKQFPKIPENAGINLQMLIEKGNIANYQVKNLALLANMENSKVNIKKLTLDILDGHVQADGSFLLDSTGITDVATNIGFDANRLNINELMNNFGKNTVSTAEKKKLELPKKVGVKLNLKAKEVIYHDLSLKNFRSAINVNDSRIRIENFHSELPFGTIDMQVTINDFLNDKISYTAAASLNLDTVSVEKLLALEAIKKNQKPPKPASTEKGKPKTLPPFFPENMDLKLNLAADRIIYEKAHIDNFSLNVGLNNKRADLKKMAFSFADGNAEIQGYVLNEGKEFYPAYFNTSINNFNIQEILRNFDNFKQDAFTIENTSGLISLKSSHHFSLNPDLTINISDNLWVFDLHIHDALLHDVKPINNSLFFIGHKAKSNMVIKDLEVKAFMQKDKLLFSEVFMNDNIANLEIFGLYSLSDSVMDLGSKISLTDLFFRSKKERVVETNEGIIPLEQDAKIFIRFNGSISDHKIKLNNRKKMDRYEKELIREINKANKEFEKKEKERKQKSPS